MSASKQMAANQLARIIATWVGANAESESFLLSPHPSWVVDAHDLLDKLHATTGLPQALLGGWAEEGKAARKPEESKP